MILDTDVMSALVAPHCPPSLSARVAAARGSLFTTSINWAEVCYGLARLPSGHELRGRYDRLIMPLLRILDFDAQSAELYGELRADLENRGTPLDEADLMVAAVALRHDRTLVSGNIRHFQRVPGLRAENWLT